MIAPLANMKKIPMNRKAATLIRLFSGLWTKYSIVMENLQKKYQEKYKECYTRNWHRRNCHHKGSVSSSFLVLSHGNVS